MMKSSRFLASAIISVLAFLPKGMQAQYVNPVRKTNLPDPSVVYGHDKYFYLYATDNGEQSVPIYKSRNLVAWRLAGSGFVNNTRPSFVANAGIWAPEVAYVGGQYVMYYALSSWGGEWTCGIGVATSHSPSGLFTDRGKLFISSEIGVQNSIDPCHFTDVDGKQYLFWGSFRGIYGIELSADGLSIKEGAEKFLIAPSSNNVSTIEATMLLRRGDYYYLFGSSGTCCEGVNSTYHVVVARSKKLEGPYLNKSNRSIMNHAFETILSKSEKVLGPGHNSEIIIDDNGRYWMLYHGFMADDPGAGRVLFLDQVKWDSEGWPYIEGGKPSVSAEPPFFSSYINTGIDDVTLVEDNELAITQGGHNYFQLSGPRGQLFTWMVSDLSGRTVESGTASQTKELWINDLENGVYVISAMQGHRKVSRKVVKCD